MRSVVLGLLVVSSLVVGCSSSGSSGTSKGSAAAAAGAGSVDPSIVGSWYAGRGGTQIAYDASTGAFGAPSGTGMLFVFHADGSYQKGVQSLETGACTTGYVVVETGTASTSGDRLALHPTKGTMHEYSCSGTMDAEHATEIVDETLTWTLEPGGPLQLVDVESGNGAAFAPTR